MDAKKRAALLAACQRNPAGHVNINAADLAALIAAGEARAAASKTKAKAKPAKPATPAEPKP